MQTILLCLTLIYTSVVYAADTKFLCGDDTWVTYKDEKCLKLHQTMETYNRAEAVCNGEDSKLVTIKSAAEQEFLTKYIYNASQYHRVWIGALRQTENITEFEWNDGSTVERWYNNWGPNRPSNFITRVCVNLVPPMLLAETFELEWQDTACFGQSWFVCEKLQAWPTNRYQREILSNRAELRRSIEIYTAEMSETRNELKELQENPVPIGFIYVQLPNQPEPSDIWAKVEWVEITSEYAGLFFRAEGEGSARFGTIQAENSPRLTSVQGVTLSAVLVSAAIPATNAFSGGISSGTTPSGSHRALQFRVSSGEVRPRNQAVRIWKRAS